MADATPAAPKVKKATKPKKAASHPPYSSMICEAVSSLKEKGGSSRQAILKYIVKTYKISADDKVAGAHLKLALKRDVVSGKLKQCKGTGAAGSFKLGAATKTEKKVEKLSKSAVKKVKSPQKKAAKPKKSAEKKTPKKPKIVKPKKNKSPKIVKPKKTKSPKKQTMKPAAKKPAKAKKQTMKPAAKKPAKAKKAKIPQKATKSK